MFKYHWLLLVLAFSFPVMATELTGPQKGFNQWCQEAESESAAVQATVAAILAKTKVDCKASETILANSSRIFLSASDIDVRVLGAHAFGVTHLSLHGVLHFSEEIAKFKRVQALMLWDSGDIDLSSLLPELPYLTVLELSGSPIVSAEELVGAQRLENLTIMKSPNFLLTTDLERLVFLNYIRLDETSVNDISFVQQLPNLEILEVFNSYIMTLEWLVGHPKIKAIDFQANYIVDVSPLRELQSLSKIALNRNYITDISPLKDMDWLTEINFEQNSIALTEETCPVTGTSELITAYCSENPNLRPVPHRNLYSLLF